MICPNCQTRNPAAAKFCFNCGVRLSQGEMIKPLAEPPTAAPAHTEPGARGAAGVSPRALPSPRRASRPNARLGAAASERRVVTIVFCDVKGSTNLAEQLDPEAWAELMNAAFSELLSPIGKFGGTVARLMGDAVLAFFGAPVAHEDDPQRAVLAGLEIIANVEAFRAGVQQRYGLEFDVRVGIHTGLVVVGDVGTELLSEYTAMGDAANLAARLQQAAPPGGVLISAETQRLVEALFDLGAPQTLWLRGKSQPMLAYRVLAPKAATGPLRGIPGLAAPLVGRAGEFDLLQSRLAAVQQGQGQIVCLVGEAGLGKSRLLRELQAASPAELTWHAHQSSSYATAFPYNAFRQLVQDLCAIQPTDSLPAIREKIACECAELCQPGDSHHQVNQAFSALLGLQPEQAGARLEGEALKRLLYEGMGSVWKAWAERGPTVVAFDDLHWADPASVELLVRLLNLVEQAPILVLCAFRPDQDAPAWQLRSAAARQFPARFTSITLEALPPSQASALVDHLLAVADLPERLRQEILLRAEGNPFFVEEVIRTLIQSGALVRENGAGSRWRAAAGSFSAEIPASLQALLLSRIDRLASGDRAVVQLASVLGRSFDLRLLLRLVEHPAGLPAALQMLEKLRVVEPLPGAAGQEYSFRHALMQEAVYHSLLLKQRRAIHQRVAEAIEELFADQRSELAPLLAHHYSAAGDRRALAHSLQAGDAAFRLFANEQALAYYSQALELALQPPAGSGNGAAAEAVDWVHLYCRRGRTFELLNRYAEALADYQALAQLGERLRQPAWLLAGLSAQAALLATPNPLNDPPCARALCEQALVLAQQLGDQAAEGRLYWVLVLVNIHSGQNHAAIAFGEQSVALARASGQAELLAFALNDVSQAYLGVGRLARAAAVLEEANPLWRQLNNLPLLADNLSASAYLDFLLGRFEAALGKCEESRRISRSIENLWGEAYSLMYTGYIYRELGEFGKMVSTMEECLRLARLAGFIAPLVVVQPDLGVLCAQFGEIERGEALVAEAEGLARARASAWTVLSLAAKARLLLLSGRPVAAAQVLEQAEVYRQTHPTEEIAIAYLWAVRLELALANGQPEEVLALAERLLGLPLQGIRIFISQAHLGRGQARLDLGHLDAAAAELEKAERLAQELGARAVLWQVWWALARLAELQGQPVVSRQRRAAAWQLLSQIAAGIENPTWRAGFLKTVAPPGAGKDILSMGGMN
jgi:class 3 adenylate cyclase/tetratricopeptide (TPR) repeat protein